MESTHHTSSTNSQIQKLLEKQHVLSISNEIIYCLIPCHIGIPCNVNVDPKAKESLNLHTRNFSIQVSNFKRYINRYILNNWHTSWDNSVNNKLYEIKPNKESSQSVVRNIRLKEVVLARIGIGHTSITHSYLLNREEQPKCVKCHKPFTVRYILLERNDLSYVHVPIDNIVLFLKEIYLFNKL